MEKKEGTRLNKILDKLYLGGELAIDPALRKNYGITHILTVRHWPLPCSEHQGYQYLYIPANDSEDADLLTKFAECFRFIEEGRNAGGVLVHCVAGVSRSATIVLAYVMKTEWKTLDDSLKLVQSKRICVRPNDGFMSQLRLFESMAFEINEYHPIYRQYKIQQLALLVQSGGKVDEGLHDFLSSDPSSSQQQQHKEQEHCKEISLYKCRKCRRPLFKSTGLLQHNVGEGDAAFDWRTKLPPSQKSLNDGLVQEGEGCVRSLFIEPVEWMKNGILSLDGKISCPKCSSKLGSYSWFGERCPCGTWVTPAFHIQTGKVDECKLRSASSSDGSHGDDKMADPGASSVQPVGS